MNEITRAETERYFNWLDGLIFSFDATLTKLDSLKKASEEETTFPNSLYKLRISHLTSEIAKIFVRLLEADNTKGNKGVLEKILKTKRFTDSW